MAEKMTSRDWSELARLSQKAAYHEREQYANENNFDMLIGVARYSGRMA